MTKKDLNFLVKVHIQKSEGDDTVISITLGQLHDITKSAKNLKKAKKMKHVKKRKTRSKIYFIMMK